MLIECPKCNEADERPVGMNRCGLCECEFFVASNGSAYAPAKRPRDLEEEKMDCYQYGRRSR